MWVDFVLAGVLYQKAVPLDRPFFMGPPEGVPGSEVDRTLVEWDSSLGCVMPVKVTPPRKG
eukprot:12648996-Heterocapsa_arctica.AAC.1